MDLEKFKCVFSDEKFKEKVLTATLNVENKYTVTFETDDGSIEFEYTKTEVETNIKKGIWVLVDNK